MTMTKTYIDAPDGYNAYDYYPVDDIATATADELTAAYRGEDSDGIGCERDWSGEVRWFRMAA